MFSAYVFWLILSKITTPEVIGTSSAVVSLSTIFTTVVIIGVPTGVQRFLGKSFSEQRFEDTRVFVKASLIMVSLPIVVCSIGILLAKDLIGNSFNIDLNLIIISIILISSSAISTLFRSIVIASLKTRILPIASIASTIVKITATIILISSGTGALGVTIGFTFAPIVAAIILAGSIILLTFKKSTFKREVGIIQACKSTIVASMASWIPGLISTVGAQLGLIVVLGANGAGQAGLYFIAFSIVTGIATGTSVLSAIAYPALSAMTDGRKRFAWRIIKMSLVISLPFSSSLVFYSKEVMGFFGSNYVQGSSTLEILLLSMLPTALMSGISILVYSYGMYKYVLTIGLATTIPRLIFYFALVSIYGGDGAALSYDIGSIVGSILCLIIARNIGMKIFWRELTVLLVTPLAIAFLLSSLRVNYILGIIVTLVISYLVFLRMNTLTRSDVCDGLGILPPIMAKPTIGLVVTIAQKLNSSF